MLPAEVVAADDAKVVVSKRLHHLARCFLIVFPDQGWVLRCPEQLIVESAGILPTGALYVDPLWEAREHTHVPHERQDRLLVACENGDVALSSTGLPGNMYPYPSFVVLANVADAQLQQLCAA